MATKEHDSYDSMEMLFCLLLYLEMYCLQYVLFASKSVGDNLHGMCRCSWSRFVLCCWREKVPTAFSPSPLLSLSLSFCLSFSLSVSFSLSFALKSKQLLGFLFMSPGSDALASKLCKFILPVKLKPSLLVLRGLLHRVLHRSLGSGPSHFPP